MLAERRHPNARHRGQSLTGVLVEDPSTLVLASSELLVRFHGSLMPGATPR